MNGCNSLERRHILSGSIQDTGQRIINSLDRKELH